MFKKRKKKQVFDDVIVNEAFNKLKKKKRARALNLLKDYEKGVVIQVNKDVDNKELIIGLLKK